MRIDNALFIERGRGLRGRSMRAIQYNPLSLIQTWRMFEISRMFKKVDIVALVGTRRKAENGRSYAQIRGRHVHHICMNWGWARGKFTNKSCGCTLPLGRSFKGAKLVEILSPSAALQGRGGAVRVTKTQCDMVIILLYVPVE